MIWHIGSLILCALPLSSADWVSEWMTALQGQLFEETPDSYRRSGSGGILKQYEDEYERMLPVLNSKEVPSDTRYTYKSKPLSAGGLKLKLETTLENARVLAEALAREIAEVTAREQVLKDTIARGRNGVTTVTVSTIGQLPRKYIIREGVWTLCTGVVQAPVAETNVYNELISPAQCFGQEVTTKPDPCVFHSVIKYETIPTRRRLQYVEDDFLCLKPSFNTTMEYYMSVPRRLINETCTDGMIRSLDDNLGECGVRVLSEYNYYPNRGYTNPDLALEYCVEPGGACKLIVAWHVSNATIENFEFLKNEPNFNKYFMKINSYSI